jgi:hypothetical protein
VEQQMDLDDSRDAIASVHRGDAHVGYLATKVEPMRSGFLLGRQERVWLLLTRLDGTLDIQEDYAPWTSVRELREGHINWYSHHGGDQAYVVHWLTGDQKQRAWLRYGVVEEVATYMSRSLLPPGST